MTFMRIAGGVAGGIGGATSPNMPKVDMPWGDNKNAFLLGGDEIQNQVRGNLDWFNKARDGSMPLMSQGEQAALIAPGIAQMGSQAQGQTKLAGERGLARGDAGRGGATEASISAINRNLLDNTRQLQSGVKNTLAQMRPQYQMDAAKAGGQMAMGQQGMAGEAWNTMVGNNADAAQYGTKTSRMFNGISRGLGG